MEKIKKIIFSLPVLIVITFIIFEIAERTSAGIITDNSYIWVNKTSGSVKITGYLQGFLSGSERIFACNESMSDVNEIINRGYEGTVSDDGFSNNFEISIQYSFSEGEYEKNIYIYLIDDEECKSVSVFTILLDTDNPSPEIMVVNGSIKNGTYYVGGEEVCLYINPSDTGSGVEYISVLLNESVVYEGYTSGYLYLPLTDGAGNLKIYFYDRAGNISESETYSLRSDLTEPYLNINIKGNVFESGGIIYISDETDITYFASDEGEGNSGLRQAYILLNETICERDVSGNGIIWDYSLSSNTVSTYSYGINLLDYKSDDGIYYLQAVAEDFGYNRTVSEYHIVVDKKPPVIESVTDGEGNDICSYTGPYLYYCDSGKELTVKVSDNDGGSGVREVIWQTVNEGNEGDTHYAVPDGNGIVKINIETDFKGFIRIGATDNVGNETGLYEYGGFICESKEKFLENTSLNITLPETEYKDANGNDLYGKGINISVTGVSSYAFIKEIKWELYDGDNILDSGSSTDGTVNLFVDKELNGMTFKATLYDKAGYSLSAEKIFGIDTVKPVLLFSLSGEKNGDSNDGFYCGPVTLIMSLNERNINPDGLKLIINDNELSFSDFVYDGSLSNGAMPGREGSMYTGVLIFDGDETYDIKAVYTDLAGNESEETYSSFSVDEAVPVINVKYDNDSEYINTSREITIEITEKYFDKNRVSVYVKKSGEQVFLGNLSWTSENGKHTSKITLSDDGYYEITVSASDRAGNRPEDFISSPFVIDTDPPVISVDGLSYGKSYNGECMADIQISDDNYDPSLTVVTLTGINHGTMDLTGSITSSGKTDTLCTGDFPYEKEYDDIYMLYLKAYDLAGNVTEKEVAFTVNRFGSVFCINPETESLKGTYVTSLNDIYIFEDNFDLRDETEIYITHNGITETFNPGDELYSEIISFETVTLDTGIIRNICGIPADLFSEDGIYEINIVTKDRAGNINDTREISGNLVSFVKDTASPNIIPINIKNDISINSDGLKAEFIISDNIMIDIINAYTDGEKADIICDGSKYYINITENSEPVDIEIIAADKAGNTYSLKISNVLVTTNPILRTFHDYYREIGAGMDITGLTGLMLIRVLRRSRSIVI